MGATSVGGAGKPGVGPFLTLTLVRFGRVQHTAADILTSPGFSSGLFIFNEVLVEDYLGATVAPAAARLGSPVGAVEARYPLWARRTQTHSKA